MDWHAQTHVYTHARTHTYIHTHTHVYTHTHNIQTRYTAYVHYKPCTIAILVSATSANVVAAAVTERGGEGGGVLAAE